MTPLPRVTHQQIKSSIYPYMSHKKSSQKDWQKLANTPDYADSYDDWYEEEIVRESKSKKREQVRFGLKEEF